MITVDLARSLRTAGLRWRPASGDRFVVEHLAEVDEPLDVFTLSDMTIEAHHYPTGTELGFNGTTEWALDSVSADVALWLPREDQLRTLLGPAFVSLTHQVDDGEHIAWTVLLRPEAVGDGDSRHVADDAESAYALALLAYLDASLRIDEISEVD
ncbi:pilus assembly protein CpaE [Frigoribacterium sp. PvP032]|uniref:pilus assembly protein CpaE n=1 Tax=Frigoribacterium sp. PvP032 TaxID=2806589 RepID=UPI001AE8E70A|nr:pilus assembly protein CpaE [Frigoribacterium sp. PvP032]MBP1189377.1 hypothetical protein [Frigoribacterium sp. PvP032]